jgi:hypothetical protein
MTVFTLGQHVKCWARLPVLSAFEKAARLAEVEPYLHRAISFETWRLKNGQASAHGSCQADAKRRGRILGNDTLHRGGLLRRTSPGEVIPVGRSTLGDAHE